MCWWGRILTTYTTVPSFKSSNPFSISEAMMIGVLEKIKHSTTSRCIIETHVADVILISGNCVANVILEEGKMIFAEFVITVRRKLGLTQKQLASAISVSYATINRWENGHAVPSNLAVKSFYDFCENNFIKIPADIP